MASKIIPNDPSPLPGIRIFPHLTEVGLCDKYYDKVMVCHL